MQQEAKSDERKEKYSRQFGTLGIYRKYRNYWSAGYLMCGSRTGNR